ncbi:MAG: WD40 repeat domain-containing serine/threonine protein kinase [Planctomycetaceae bacterium]
MTREHSDRNLLLGMLAVQFHYVTQPALIKAMHGWMLERHRPLEEILIEQGALTPDQRDKLLGIFKTYVEQHGGNVEQSLASIKPEPALAEQLQALPDADVHASVMSLAPQSAKTPPKVRDTINNLLSDESTATVGESTLNTLPGMGAGRTRFQKLRHHKSGGLGDVFKAKDTELNREVALKEIRPKLASHPDVRSRFLREGRITGDLEHPGVVPVYSLSQYPDGRPYYAMRFIRGKSLKQAIQEFHASHATEAVGPKSAAVLKPQPAPTTPTAEQPDDLVSDNDADGLKFDSLEKLIRRLITVCETIAYAHSRGVVHRDLKPDNIMLGKFGETYVVDWGLAKAKGETEPIPDSDYSIEPPVAPRTAGENVNTFGAFGTPAYMSPEQASGDPSKVSFPTDIYALGATLYHILTSKPPIGASPESKLPTPRKLNPKAPRNLEFICQKAMAEQPEQRFKSTLEMAAALQATIDDCPIAEWSREPLSDRGTRWIRNHPRKVTAFTTALLAMLGMFFVIADKENKNLAELARKDKANSAARLKDSAAIIKLQVENELRQEAIQQKHKAVKTLLNRTEDEFVEKLNENKKSEALSWAIAAAKYEREGEHPDWPRRESIHRQRIAMLLREFSELEYYIPLGGPVVFADLTADRKRLVTLHADERVHIVQRWDVSTATPIGVPITLETYDGATLPLLNAAGDRIAVPLFDQGNGQHVIQIYDLETGSPARPAIATGGLLLAIRFDPTGQFLLANVLERSGVSGTLSGDKSEVAIRAWDTQSDKPSGKTFLKSSERTEAMWFDDRRVLIRTKTTAQSKTLATSLFEFESGKDITPEWFAKYPTVMSWMAVSSNRERLAFSRVAENWESKSGLFVVDFESGEEVTVFQHQGVARELRFINNDSQLLVVASEQIDANRNSREFVQVHDLGTKQLVFDRRFDTAVAELSVDPESGWISIGTKATEAKDGLLSVSAWMPDRNPLPDLVYKSTVRCAKFTAGNERMVVVTNDGVIRIMNLKRNGLGEDRSSDRFVHDTMTRSALTRLSWMPNRAEPEELDFGRLRIPLSRSADGELVLVKEAEPDAKGKSTGTAPAFRQISVWNLKTKQRLRQWSHTHDIEAGWISPDRHHVAFATRRSPVPRPWNPFAGIELPTLVNLQIVTAEDDPEAVRERDPQPRLWLCDLEREQEPVELPHAGLISEVVFLPALDRMVVVAGNPQTKRGSMQLHELRTGAVMGDPVVIQQQPIEVSVAAASPRFLVRVSNGACSVFEASRSSITQIATVAASDTDLGFLFQSAVLRSDGSRFYVASSTSVVAAYRVPGDKLWERTFSATRVTCIRENEPRQELVVATNDGQVHVLDALTGKPKGSFRLTEGANSLGVSADGKILATLTETGIPQFRDTETLRPISNPQTPRMPREQSAHAVQFDQTNQNAFVFRVGAHPMGVPAVPSELIRLDASEWDWKAADEKCLMATQRTVVISSSRVVFGENELSEQAATDLLILHRFSEHSPEHWPTQLAFSRESRKARMDQEFVKKLLQRNLERTIARPIPVLNELGIIHRETNDVRGLIATQSEILARTVDTGDIARLAKVADELREASPKISLEAVKKLTARLGNPTDSEANQILFGLRLTAIVAHLAIGQWAEAESSWKTHEDNPVTKQANMNSPSLFRAINGAIHANIMLGSGKLEEHRRVCQEMVAGLSPESTGPELMLTLVATYSVADALEDWSVLLPHFDRLSKTQVFDADLACLHGCTLYRSGKVTEAILVLKEAIAERNAKSVGLLDRNKPRLPKAIPTLFLAMSHQKLGDTAKANQALQHAQQTMAEEIKAAEDVDAPTLVTAVRRGHFQRLLQEARKLGIEE